MITLLKAKMLNFKWGTTVHFYYNGHGVISEDKGKAGAICCAEGHEFTTVDLVNKTADAYIRTFN